MSKPISIGFTFANASQQIPLSELDSNFATLVSAINNYNNYGNYFIDTGSANSLSITVSGNSWLAAGTPFQIQVANSTNISGVTILVNGSGPFSIVNADGSALSSNAFVAGEIICLIYDGTYFRWVSGGGAFSGVSTATGTANQVAVSSSTGNVTFSLAPNVVLPTPTSGVALTVNGYNAAGADVADFNYNFNSSAIMRLTNSNTGANASSSFVLTSGTAGVSLELDNGNNASPNFNITANSGVGVKILSGGLARMIVSSVGSVTIAPPTSGFGLSVAGTNNYFTSELQGSSVVGQSYGLAIKAGSNASDIAFLIQNQSSASTFMTVYGDGGAVFGAATGGDQGLGTVNATGLYVNGVAVATGAAPANPTGTVGLTAVNGTAATFLRSDGAPALSQAIVPTWTGLHTFNGKVVVGQPTTGVALTVTGITGSSAAQFLGTGVQVGSPTGGDQGSGTVNVAGGYYVNGVQVVVPTTGTFTATYTGFASNPSGTARYSINGSTCTIIFPLGTATSNATSFTITGLPAACQPTRNQFVPVSQAAIENNGVNVAGNPVDASFAAASGTVTLYLSGLNNSWTASGTKGASSAFSVTYGLN